MNHPAVRRGAPFKALIDITRPAAARADVLAAFDALAIGETLVVRTAERPQASLAALRAQRAGTYEWTPLAEGPGRWEVEVHRRNAPPGTLRRLTEAMVWDHRRLDALDEAATESWHAGDRPAACRLHLRFVFALLRHMRFEEEEIFPAFDRISGIDPRRGPTGLMRVEHRVIESLLHDVKAAADRGRRAAAPVRSGLRALLLEHDGKEEMVAYNALERALSARESDEMVFRFQAMAPASQRPAQPSL